MTVLVAHAKLTLGLRIVGIRDDGYHLIDAEMVTVSLHDTIHVQPGDSLTVRAAATGLAVPADADNLVSRALARVGRRRAVTIDKAIPAGAGLGGGSADAAAILRWAGDADVEGAASLGADVAFCLVGGRARVQGIGEQVTPLPFRPATFTLLTPPMGVPTARVYRAWDELDGPRGDAGNDLEPAALSVVPGLARWRDALGDATGRRPRLAGSGGTWFVDGAHRVALDDVEGVVVDAVPAPPAGG